MSSASSQPVSVAKTPFLAAAALFLGVATLVFALAIKPLGAAELVGLLACAAAAAAFATIPFVLDFARSSYPSPAPVSAPLQAAPAQPAAPAIDADQLAAQVAAAIDVRLAAALPQLAAQIAAELSAAEERRRAELQATLAATTPARPVDADAVSAPAGAKPRLGRGLLGLMHAPAALAAKPGPTADATPEPAAPEPENRAAA